MSYGSTAYKSYIRIRSESDERTFPDWADLPHVRRLAWEAAAQAVAMAVLPFAIVDDPYETDELLNEVDEVDEAFHCDDED